MPLANSPDLTMALIVDQVIDKHCSTSVSRTRTFKLIDFKSGHFPCLSVSPVLANTGLNSLVVNNWVLPTVALPAIGILTSQPFWYAVCGLASSLRPCMS